MWWSRAVQYPDNDESLAEALDQLLDNPDFLDAVADELVYQVSRSVCGHHTQQQQQQQHDAQKE
jgi:hypothetical protein